MRGVITTCQRIINSSCPVHVFGERCAGKQWLAQAMHYNSARALRNQHRSLLVELDCNSVDLPSTNYLDVRRALNQKLEEATEGIEVLTEARGKGEAKATDVTLCLYNIEPLNLVRTATAAVVDFFKQLPLGSKLISTAGHRKATWPNVIAEFTHPDDRKLFDTQVVIEHPPLKERREDIVPQAVRLMQAFERDLFRPDAPVQRHTSGLTYKLTPEAADVLKLHTWPGNMEELYQVCADAFATCSDYTIDLTDLPIAMLQQHYQSALAPFWAARLSQEELIDEYTAFVYQATGGHIKAALNVLKIHEKSIMKHIDRRAKLGFKLDPPVKTPVYRRVPGRPRGVKVHELYLAIKESGMLEVDVQWVMNKQAIKYNTAYVRLKRGVEAGLLIEVKKNVYQISPQIPT